MLQKTVYFRTQEDLDLFNALPNKTQWLHSKLHADGAKTSLKPVVDAAIDLGEEIQKTKRRSKHVNYLKGN